MSEPKQPTTRHDRILGALLGVHAGDSLGATFEFEAWEDIRSKHPKGIRDIVGGGHFSWPAGHATDDTDLTRAVLLAYRDVYMMQRLTRTDTDAAAIAKPIPDVVKLAGNYMLDWYDGRWPGRTRGQTPRDIGAATAKGLRKYRQTADPRKAGSGEGSAGNGSLMRCIPTALFGPDEATLGPEDESESKAISAITHDDYLCTISCAAYNAIVRALVDGKTVAEACQVSIKTAGILPPDAGIKLTRASAKVQTAIEAGISLVKVDELAEKGPKEAANARKLLPFKGAGYVLESLTIAIAALVDARPLEEVVVDVVRIGRDTDSNAAIAGGLLGARDGVQAIPRRWREKLQFAKEFEDIVDEMTEA
ncbi:ADP-ribosyl glycohydrolase [Naviculisporaceae sp. PSN 640]